MTTSSLALLEDRLLVTEEHDPRDDYVSIGRAHKITGISVATLRRWCDQGKFQARKDGRWTLHLPSLLAVASQLSPTVSREEFEDLKHKVETLWAHVIEGASSED